MSFKNRLKTLMDIKDLNPNSLSNKLGYRGSEKISRLIRNENNQPGFNIIRDLSNLFDDLNLKWLLTGEGDMFLKNNDNQVNESVESYGKRDEKIKELELRVKELQEQNQRLLDILSNLSKNK